MKKLFSIFLSGLAIASTTLSFQSCADEYDPAIVTKHDLTVNQYTENFIKHYGEIDPNHTWGFGPMNTVLINGHAATRANDFGGVGDVNVERNMWVQYDPNQKKYKDGALINTVSIPGWPNFDNYYYTDLAADGQKFITEASLKDGLHPVGDVTEFEILYVSNYFRTHTFEEMRPDMVQLHLTDFFIQDVCSDADQDGYDKANYGRGNNKTKIFGESTNFEMDQLRFKTINSTPYNSETHQVDDTWTHINNFNRNTQNFDPENHAGNNGYRTIMYVTSSGTEDFAYHPSFNDDGAFFNKWVLVRLTWQEVGQDGNIYTREGYYLAFNYETYKTENENKKYYDADDYFSNWIVKITPATPRHREETKRIMCEDLGNTYDFDFNDVVFDVYFQENKNTSSTEAVITLQAAGGTLPITVGVNPNGENPHKAEYEAHRMLGQTTTNTPVNVGSGAAHSIANYRIPATPRGDGKYYAEDIKVYVNNGGSVYVVDETVPGNGNLNNYTGSVDNNHTDINNGSNNAPQKFAVPVTVQWMRECQFIEKGYPHFPDWVSQQSGNENWYEKEVNSSFIYEYRVAENPSNSQPSGVLNTKYTVTLQQTTGGTIACTNMEPNANGEITNLVRSTFVKVTATPADGYTFQKWEDGSTNPERTIMVLQNMTISATFTQGGNNSGSDSNEIQLTDDFDYSTLGTVVNETLTSGMILAQTYFDSETAKDIVITLIFPENVSNFTGKLRNSGQNISKEINQNIKSGYAYQITLPGDVFWEIAHNGELYFDFFYNRPSKIYIKCIDANE